VAAASPALTGVSPEDRHGYVLLKTPVMDALEMLGALRELGQ